MSSILVKKKKKNRHKDTNSTNKFPNKQQHKRGLMRKEKRFDCDENKYGS